MKLFRICMVAAAGVGLAAGVAAAEPVPAEGYLYQGLVLSELTEGCVQAGPGGTFVGVGPAFPPFPDPVPPATRSILFVTESGAERTVATGFNAIADCVYDDWTDTLYVLDNGGEFAGATTGDTVHAVADASVAAGESADTTELVPAGSIPFGASIAQDALGALYVSDAAGSGAGSVSQIVTGVLSPFVAGGFDFTGGLAFDDSGRLFVAEAVEPSFASSVSIYDASGTAVGALTDTTFDHGSVDAVFDDLGGLLVTGGTTLASIDQTGTTTSLIAFPGFTFGGGVDVDRFAGRIEFGASTFTGADDDRTLHRMVRIDALTSGRGSAASECALEAYGIRLVAKKAGRPARVAICTDGAACDADGLVDEVCTFPLGFCLGVSDARFPECTPDAISAFEAGARPASAALDTLAARIQAALPGSPGTCEFSDGVQVAVRTTRGGKKKTGKARVKAAVTTGGPKAARDRDVFKLHCNPAS